MDTQQTKDRREMLSALMDGQLHGAAFAQTLEYLVDDANARADWHCYHVVGDVLRSPELAGCRDDAAFLLRFQARMALEPSVDRPVDLPQAMPQFASEVLVSTAATADAAGIFDAQSKAASQRHKAANESTFRWKLVAGLASLAAVSVMGWNMLATTTSSLGGAQLAQADGGGQQSVSPVVLASAALPATQRAGTELSSTMAGQAESMTPVPPAPYGSPSATQVAGLPAEAATQAVTLPSGAPQVMLRNPRLDALMAAHKQFGGTSALQTPASFLREATFEAPE